MSKERCCACYTELEEGKADCSVCGLPNIKILGDAERAVVMKKQLGEEHRQEMLSNIDISIIAYTHEMVNGKLKVKSSDCTKIAEAKHLIYGKNVWFDENFARIDTDKKLQLNVLLTGKKKQEVTLEFTAPKLEDFWHIGVCMKEGFRVSLKIGNENVFSETKEISLI